MRFGPRRGRGRGRGGTLTSALGPDCCWGFSAAAAADVSAAADAAAAAAALKHVFVIHSFSSRERRPAKHGGWRVRSSGGSWVCAACAHRRVAVNV